MVVAIHLKDDFQIQVFGSNHQLISLLYFILLAKNNLGAIITTALKECLFSDSFLLLVLYSTLILNAIRYSSAPIH